MTSDHSGQYVDDATPASSGGCSFMAAEQRKQADSATPAALTASVGADSLEKAEAHLRVSAAL